MKPCIIITGTPGTGKTTLGKKLALLLKARRLDVSSHYQDLSAGLDKERRCWIIDGKKLLQLVKKEVKALPRGQYLIIDSHLAHHLPPSLVRVCIVLTCSTLKELKRRLQKRKYPAAKIRENLDAEIFQVCLTEAQERKHRIVVIDTGKKPAIGIIQKIVRMAGAPDKNSGI